MARVADSPASTDDPRARGRSDAIADEVGAAWRWVSAWWPGIWPLVKRCGAVAIAGGIGVAASAVLLDDWRDGDVIAAMLVTAVTVGTLVLAVVRHVAVRAGIRRRPPDGLRSTLGGGGSRGRGGRRRGRGAPRHGGRSGRRGGGHGRGGHPVGRGGTAPARRPDVVGAPASGRRRGLDGLGAVVRRSDHGRTGGGRRRRRRRRRGGRRPAVAVDHDVDVDRCSDGRRRRRAVAPLDRRRPRALAGRDGARRSRVGRRGARRPPLVAMAQLGVVLVADRDRPVRHRSRHRGQPAAPPPCRRRARRHVPRRCGADHVEGHAAGHGGPRGTRGDDRCGGSRPDRG